MKIPALILASPLACIPFAFAANSFAGSNLYYAPGLSEDEQNTLFSGMQSGELHNNNHFDFAL